MYTIYGLPNCDTTRMATKWMEAHNIPYTFHNLKDGIALDKLKSWCKQKDWQKLLNKQSMTFRNLHPAIKQNATTVEKAIEIMEARPITIKRPLLEKNDKLLHVGFDATQYEIECL